MNRHRLRSAAVAMLLLAALAAPTSAQKVTLKMATLVPQGSAWYEILQELGQTWQQLSGGRVTLRLYGGGVAGSDGDIVRKMRLGTLDAGVLTAAGMTDIDLSVNCLTVPLLYASYEEYDAVAAEVTPQLEQVFAAKGFTILAWADAGWIHLFTRSPVAKPADVAGMKVFAWGADSKTVGLLQAAGFTPVPLPATEISTALQTGLVHAVPTTPQAALLLQWFNHTKYMTDVPWAVLTGAMVFSQAGWEKVPADLRPVLAAAARDAGRKLDAATRSGAQADIDAMAKRGLTVVPVDAAARDAWRQLAVSLYPKMRGEYAPPEHFDRALALRDAFRARQGK